MAIGKVRVLFLAAAICMAGPVSALAGGRLTAGKLPLEQPAWKLYNGAYFSVKYPADFIARGGMRSTTNASGYDSATFSSKDGNVVFYVFSPQWSGEARDIALKAGEHKLAGEKAKAGDTAIVRYTIAGRGGSYRRSYESRHDKVSGTDLVLGIKYKNAAILEQYRSKYVKFKQSLVQFADH